MSNVAIHKVRDLTPPVRRTLERFLGRNLQLTEVITVLASQAVGSDLNGDGPSCYEIAKRCKIIGIVKNAPTDLSVNTEYFEGFGD